jgi:hypothetical protein
LWEGRLLFVMPRLSGIVERYFNTKIEGRIKSLLTLLELTEACLHDG